MRFLYYRRKCNIYKCGNTWFTETSLFVCFSLALCLHVPLAVCFSISLFVFHFSLLSYSAFSVYSVCLFSLCFVCSRSAFCLLFLSLSHSAFCLLFFCFLSLSDPKGAWVNGFFDYGSFMEMMQPWAQSVVVGRARWAPAHQHYIEIHLDILSRHILYCHRFIYFLFPLH